MITAIILSAGEGRRMGTQKVLLPYGGKTVIEHIVRALQDGGADQVIAVTGYQADRVASALQNTAARIAFNEDHRTGMLSSVRCGLRAASTETAAFLIALGDQPSIRSGVVRKLVHEFEAQERNSGTILLPTYGGRRGHPMMFSHHFRDDVLTRFDSVGLRGLLAAYPDAVREITVEQSEILRDIDYPQDYANELDALEKAEQENDGSLES